MHSAWIFFPLAELIVRQTKPGAWPEKSLLFSASLILPYLRLFKAAFRNRLIPGRGCNRCSPFKSAVSIFFFFFAALGMCQRRYLSLEVKVSIVGLDNNAEEMHFLVRHLNLDLAATSERCSWNATDQNIDRCLIRSADATNNNNKTRW